MAHSARNPRRAWKYERIFAGFGEQRRVSGETKRPLMNYLRFLSLGSAAGLALAGQLRAQSANEAQPPGAVPATKPQRAAPSAAALEKQARGLRERRIDIEFNGLDLSAAMEFVRAQLPELNVVVPPRLASTPIGQLKLHNVTLAGLVQAITAATDGVVNGEFVNDEYLTFTNDQAERAPEPVCRVLSLRQYLGGKNERDADRAIDELTEVVTLACKQLERGRNGSHVAAPEFSVHRATKLLIAVGAPEAVAIVEEVVSAASGTSTGNNPNTGFGVGPTGLPGFGGGGNSFPGGGFGGGNPFASPKGAPSQLSQPSSPGEGTAPGGSPPKP